MEDNELEGKTIYVYGEGDEYHIMDMIGAYEDFRELEEDQIGAMQDGDSIVVITMKIVDISEYVFAPASLLKIEKGKE